MPTKKPRGRCRKCERRLLIEDMYLYQYSAKNKVCYCVLCWSKSVHIDIIGHRFTPVSTPAGLDTKKIPVGFPVPLFK